MAKEDKKPLRCAIYTRKSTQEGLEQEFNSLDAQREAGEAYIKSQKHENWILLPKHYDDGGFSGGSLERPALHTLIADIKKCLIDVVVVYKVDRLSRSLHDFAKLVEVFEEHNVSFVSVTQQFNTTSSMGRLTLNILLSFAQFEREVIGERVRDKIAASRQKGMWMGGTPPLGYDVKDKKLHINPKEAETVRFIFEEYLASTSTLDLIKKLKDKGIKTKSWTSAKSGTRREGRPLNKGRLYQFLHCRTYIGEAVHRGKSWPGLHEAIVSKELFDKVQAKLATQNSKADCNRHPSQGILQGLVFDVDGRAYSPVCHVRRGRKPYAYYVSQKALREGYDTVEGIKSIRVEDVDKLVLKHIQNMLPKGWEHIRFKEKQAALRQCMEKVIICKDRIDLVLKTKDSLETQSISVQLQKIGRKKVMMNSEGKDIVPIRANKDPALIKALVRAHKWEKALTTRQEKSLGTISKNEDLQIKYVTQIYRLNFLAPKIKESILDGNQPQGLTLSRLMRNIPLCWKEQERFYGF
jgi:site-specific DNA recombinase